MADVAAVEGAEFEIGGERASVFDGEVADAAAGINCGAI